MSTTAEARAKLLKIKLTRSILDDNINVIQRQNKDAFGTGIHLCNPHMNPDILSQRDMKEIRARRIVGNAISALSEQVKHEVQSNQLAESVQPLRRRPVPQQPPKVIPKKSFSSSATKSKGQKPTYLFPGKKSQSKKPAPRPRKMVSDNELDHVYGVAPHANQRRTVFNPYIHIASPKKDPKYRSRRATETLKASHVRSEKCQTDHDNPVQVSFLVSQPTFVETPGKALQSSAIPIGPPVIINNEAEPVYLDAHKVSCHLSTEEESMLTPVLSPIPKPKPVPRKPETPPPAVKKDDDELPGKCLEPEDSEVSDTSLPVRVQLTGNKIQQPVVVCCPDAMCMLCRGIAPATCTCKKPVNARAQRPTSPCCCEQTVRGRKKVAKLDLCEQEATRWVEEEVMARVLSEMYPCNSKWKVPCKGRHAERGGDTSYVEERGLPFVMDAGFDLSQGSMRKLLEEELRDIIKQMIGERYMLKRPPSPPPSPPPPPCVLHHSTKDQPLRTVPTPVSTPLPSPRYSPKEIRVERAATPAATPRESLSESKESTALDEISPPSQIRSLSPNCLTENDENRAPTPDLTPRHSPDMPTPAGTPPPPKEPKTKKVEPVRFVDAWEGVEFPLAEDTNPHARRRRPEHRCRYPLDDDPCDVIVRAVTPPPRDAVVQVESDESSSDELTEETRTDQTISEGQLVVSHGEIKPKKIPYLNKLMPYYDNDETLCDVININDDDTGSEGEINAKLAGRRIPGLPPHVPSVYARPRQPLPRPDTDDEVDAISVGEVVDDGDKREKFRAWKEEQLQRAHNSSSSSSAGAVAEKDFAPVDTATTLHESAGVIRVAPIDDDDDDDDEVGELPPPMRTTSDVGGALGHSLHTTGGGSAIPPDSLDDSGGRNLVSALAAVAHDDNDNPQPTKYTAAAVKNLSFRLPHQDAVDYDDDDDEIEEIQI